MFRSIVVVLLWSAPAMAQSGFEPLFNGRDLTGWHYMPDFDVRKLAAMPEADRAALRNKWANESAGHWFVDNGVLVNNGQGAFLTSDKNYGDIELQVEFRIGPKGDSGVYLRGCPQIQIWDPDDPDQKKNGAEKGSGGLWNNSPGTAGKDPLVRADNAVGQWNRFRIINVGERVSVWLNDQLVVDHVRLENYHGRKTPLARTGPIQLQTHGHETRFRNLLVREIDAEEANAILARQNRPDDGFASIFNGRDFTGWAGPVDHCEVRDGAIVCLPNKAGTIHTAEEFSDFVVRFEYKLPPGGNNGLAIRYPGTGDTAYVGMCELQILDDDDPKYNGLEARQRNMSVYAMAAAHRGYLRPVGQWNFAEVTVRGSKIVAELNGTRVLDCDLSKIYDFLEGKPHPGKDRKSGYFGLAGHGDPVAFRNLRIKRLTQ